MRVTKVTESQALYISEQDIYLDEAGAPVEATDPKRHALYVRRGGLVPEYKVIEWGLDYLGGLPPEALTEDVVPSAEVPADVVHNDVVLEEQVQESTMSVPSFNPPPDLLDTVEAEPKARKKRAE